MKRLLIVLIALLFAVPANASITYIGQSQTTDATRTNTTASATLDTGTITNGDMLILLWGEAGNVTPTSPSGFAAFTNLSNCTTTDVHLYVWWKRASSESGDYVTTHSSALTQAQLLVFRGVVGGGSPENVTSTCTTKSGTDPVATGVTTTRYGVEIIAAYAADGGIAAGCSTPTGTTPTFTERLDTTGIMCVDEGRLAAVVATGDKTSTAESQNWASGLVALTPATGFATMLYYRN